MPATVRRPAVEETGIRCATPGPRELRKFLSDAVIICALRILRRDAKTPIALVEIAAAGNVFVVAGIFAIRNTARPAIALTLLELPA